MAFTSHTGRANGGNFGGTVYLSQQSEGQLGPASHLENEKVWILLCLPSKSFCRKNKTADSAGVKHYSLIPPPAARKRLRGQLMNEIFICKRRDQNLVSALFLNL